MLRVADWTRGLPEFLHFLGWFFIVCGAALGVVWATSYGGDGEIWAFAFFGLLGLLLGPLCLLISWVWHRLERSAAPGDRAV